MDYRMDELRSILNVVTEDLSKISIERVIGKLPPLHRAVADGNLRLLEELLRRGEDPDDGDGSLFNCTAVHWAARMGDEQLMDMLDRYGANMSSVDETDMSPLHYAVLAGNRETLVWLLDNTGDIEAKDMYSQTPLHQAPFTGKLEAAKILVSYGASLDPVDDFGLTPLCIAVARGLADMTAFFLEKGADPTVRDERGDTLLHSAAANDDVVTMQWVLDRGVEVDSRNKMNLTPLHFAARSGSCRAVALLLDKGADIEAKDDKGQTPWFKAEEALHFECASLLLDRGATHSVVPNDGTTDSEFDVIRSEAYYSYLDDIALEGTDSPESEGSGNILITEDVNDEQATNQPFCLAGTSFDLRHYISFFNNGTNKDSDIAIGSNDSSGREEAAAVDEPSTSGVRMLTENDKNGSNCSSVEENLDDIEKLSFDEIKKMIL